MNTIVARGMSLRQTLVTAVSLAVLCVLLLVASAPCARAEVKLLGPFSFRAFLPAALPQFEQSSGHKVTVGYTTLGAITKSVLDGEVVDVVMVSPAQIEEL